MRSSLQAAAADAAALLEGLVPWDEHERADRDRALAWLGSTDDIWRRARPAAPSPHLVAYVLLVDPDVRRVLLCDHRLSGLWLPAGGHVEPGEHPLDTARREAAEELGLSEATLLPDVPAPFFTTWTRTVGQEEHVHVSLWFALLGCAEEALAWDAREFHGVRWWHPDEVGAADAAGFDPQLGRALDKLGLLSSDRPRRGGPRGGGPQ